MTDTEVTPRTPIPPTSVLHEVVWLTKQEDVENIFRHTRNAYLTCNSMQQLEAVAASPIGERLITTAAQGVVRVVLDSVLTYLTGVAGENQKIVDAGLDRVPAGAPAPKEFNGLRVEPDWIDVARWLHSYRKGTDAPSVEVIEPGAEAA